MGVHHLVTGLNGHGKTLVLVAELLPKMLKEKLYKDGKPVDRDRRLVIGGVRNLLMPHELMEVPEIDPESFKDTWGQYTREAHEPPAEWVRAGEVGRGDMPEDADPVVYSILNWWLWCQPGDIIVVDEAQRVFRPMAAGRRVPRFIARLETARHYGVQLVYLTQHPDLLHKNVRQLVGPHEHVERMLGTSRVMVYQWPRCANPDSREKATKRTWKHDKKAFGKYASAELHTTFKERIPLAVYAFGVALVALAGLLWKLVGTFNEVATPPATAKATQPGQAGTRTSTGSVVQRTAAPLLGVVAPIKDREPFEGRGLHLDGTATVDGRTITFFGVSIDGRRVATITADVLYQAGYSWTHIGTCAGLLEYRGRERSVTCDTPYVPPRETQVEPRQADQSRPEAPPV